MARQAEYYREETARRMKALTRVMAWGVYAVVGVVHHRGDLPHGAVSTGSGGQVEAG